MKKITSLLFGWVLAAIAGTCSADMISVTHHIDATGPGSLGYTLFDVYPHADLITYPSYYEGFGNAFLEAIYFGKPVVVNTYAVYARDSDPLGFKTIEMSQVVTRHGGRVVAHSRVGEGTRVTVFLPAEAREPALARAS